ncbi:MAG: tetratricopeptide repeat protein [Candidatus Sumerlaeia bacterium]|nr:tetratricopeptide repeat protein [Candidatus Sumerlaeia bacterium]
MWVAFATLGRDAEGRALLERAIKEYPFAEGIALPLAASYLEARRPHDALPVLQAYIRAQGGGERKAMLMLAEALSQAGRKADALEAVRLVLQHNPDDAEAAALLLAIQRRR